MKRGLKPGTTNNPNGRPKGAKNKVPHELREKITDFLSVEFENVKKEFKKLTARDKLRFYTDLMQYSVPKLQAMQLETEFEKLSDDDLNKIIQELIKANNDSK